jgi:hypothetical protein
MKPNRTIKRRNRLEGQIAKAAESDVGVALQLAVHGHKFTPPETAVWIYLACQGFKKKPGVRTMAPGHALNLVDVFLDAVDRRDGDTLREITRAVETFPVDSAEPPSADMRRALVLNWKRYCESTGEKQTLKQLACYVYGPKAALTADHYSALRRLAKTFKSPLAKDKIGRPKKSDK